MKIFRSEQIKAIDGYTIKNEPIVSIDLMERAAGQLLRWYTRSFDRTRRVIIFVGPGNNGGDGLALARLLAANRFDSEVHYIQFTEKRSEDWKSNRHRLEKESVVPFKTIEKIEQFPLISSDDIIVDAIFGSGLTKPAEGLAAAVIKQINKAECVVISVDIPSGLFGEDNSSNDNESIVRADFTLSFQFPKLSFMFAENAKYVGDWIILPIDLNSTAIGDIQTPYSLLENDFISSLLKTRNKFDHKGIFGHALLVAGSYGKIGSSILGAKAALRTGVGLITCHVPSCGNSVIQAALPEAMIRTDNSDKIITDIQDIDNYDAIGIGPGIGTDPLTQKAFHTFLLNRSKTLVIDADGINILGMNKKWLSALPPETILTPHVKEFERIAGKAGSSFNRLEKQLEFSGKYKCIVVLKGAYTSVVTPKGKVYFNNTGNPGMATA